HCEHCERNAYAISLLRRTAMYKTIFRQPEFNPVCHCETCRKARRGNPVLPQAKHNAKGVVTAVFKIIKGNLKN
ncbi:MAG: hypothetical protein J6U05_06060, partial [Neisseriaceae bacterium]|nr:hypothetical protein [Neisseriaceae bacterium]